MVIDLDVLRQETDEITRHLGRRPRLLLSETAHLILPYHRVLEDLEGMSSRFGTTRRGIAPAYRDRAAKVGVRVGDLLSPSRLRERIGERLEALRRAWPAAPEIWGFDAEKLSEDLLGQAGSFLSEVGDGAATLRAALDARWGVLFEGAQGALLDVDFGTYPYVTSSSTTLAGLPSGVGLPRVDVERRIGVAKAYLTRVGDGPFPTELLGGLADRLRERGGEFGATTGRPRRCGWLDLVALRHATALNVPTSLAITKLDILSGIGEIKVCVAYRLRGEKIARFPAAAEDLAECTPIYETLPGWSEGLCGAREYGALPKEARAYLAYVAEGVGVPIGLVSIGPNPEETIKTGFDSP